MLVNKVAELTLYSKLIDDWEGGVVVEENLVAWLLLYKKHLLGENLLCE